MLDQGRRKRAIAAIAIFLFKYLQSEVGLSFLSSSLHISEGLQLTVIQNEAIEVLWGKISMLKH